MKNIIIFCITYIIALLIYLIFVVLPALRNKRKGKEKEVLEVKYLVVRYGLNLKKINYKKLLVIILFVSSLDITILANIVILFDIGYLLQLLIAAVVVVPLFMGSYKLVSLLYKGKVKKKWIQKK